MFAGKPDVESDVSKVFPDTEHVVLRLMAKVSPEVRFLAVWVTGDDMAPICKLFSVDEDKTMGIIAGKRLFQCFALDSNQRVIYTAEKEQMIEMNVVNDVNILNEELLKPFTIESATEPGRTTITWNSGLKDVSYIVTWNESGKAPVSEPPVSVPSITKTDLINGKDYHVAIGIIANDICPMILSKDTVISIPPLDVPSNPKAVGSDRKITLSWSSANTDATYDIYWNTSGSVSKSSNVITGIAQKMYEHEGLENGKSYCYRISQVVSGVSSSLSEEVCATPVAPEQFSIIVSDCGFILDDKFELTFNNVRCENDFGAAKECFFDMVKGVHNLDVVFKNRSTTDPTDPGTMCLQITSDSASFVQGGLGQVDDKNVRYYFPPNLGAGQTWLIDLK
jgi:hypothetical protein